MSAPTNGRLLSDKAWRHPVTKSLLADLSRIRSEMSPFLGRLRERLRSDPGAWRPEILITLTGTVDASLATLRPIGNQNIMFRLRQYYEELAEYDRSSHRLNALPHDKIGRRDIQHYHLLFTRKHRETMFLHDILRTGHNVLEATDGVEAESLAINELWDFEYAHTPDPDFSYPPSGSAEGITLQ
jgi:hypothetical protein